MQITKDTVVQFHYTLTDEDGKMLDGSAGRDPFAYLHGAGMIVAGLEEKLEGQKAGDALEVIVPPEKGYGLPDPRMVMAVPKDRFGDQKVEAGMQFQAGEEGQLGLFTVTKVSSEEVTLDGNHPLAGVTLKFHVEVVEVREATQEELSHGHVHGPGGHHH